MLDRYLASSCCQMKAPSLWPTACSSAWPAAWCARSGTSWSWRRCGRPGAGGKSFFEECRPHIMTVQLSEMDGPVVFLQLSEILLLQWFLQNPKHIWGHGCSSGWHSRLPFWHISLAFGKASLVILEKVRLTWDNKILGSFPLGSEWSSLASPRELSHQDSIPFKLKLLELVGMLLHLPHLIIDRMVLLVLGWKCTRWRTPLANVAGLTKCHIEHI